MMFVDPELLVSGASHSHRAGGHAQAGADQLSRGPLSQAMFGTFGAADVFHQAVRSAHGEHVSSLQAHHEGLVAVGGKAHHAATEFATMDEHNAERLRAV
jgi:Protein of unknown function (DUF2563)